MTKPIGSTYADTLQALKDTAKQDAPHCGIWGILLPSWAMAMRQARKLADATRKPFRIYKGRMVPAEEE